MNCKKWQTHCRCRSSSNAHLTNEDFRKGHLRILSWYASPSSSHWRTHQASRETLAFNDLAYAPGSPGCILKLDEPALADRLERLEAATEGELVYGETAGLRQLYRRRDVPELQYVDCHYETVAGAVAVEV